MNATPIGDITKIVTEVREAYNCGLTRPLKWRRQQLGALRRMLQEHEQAVVDAITKDLRRPKAETVLTSTTDVLAQVAYMEKHLDTFTRTTKLSTPLLQQPLSFEVWKEPLGVVTIISPWNYPICLTLTPLVGVIAAGNACILKPSELSVASADLLARLISEYLDKSAIRVVTGGVPETTVLLEQKVDHIMFTGGSRVGRVVMAAAAKHLTPVTLELGGKCPVYVDQSANLETTARRVVWAKCLNAGQTCIAPDHVFIHEKVRDAFLKSLKAEHDRLYPGDLQKNPDLSRIINNGHFKRLESLLLDNHGGEVVMGGNMAEKERFMPMTVVVDPSLDSELMKSEFRDVRTERQG